VQSFNFFKGFLLHFLHVLDNLQCASEQSLLVSAENLTDVIALHLEHVRAPIYTVFLLQIFFVLDCEGFHKFSAIKEKLLDGNRVFFDRPDLFEQLRIEKALGAHETSAFGILLSKNNQLKVILVVVPTILLGTGDPFEAKGNLLFEHFCH
jgi:hypothetical protein